MLYTEYIDVVKNYRYEKFRITLIFDIIMIMIFTSYYQEKQNPLCKDDQKLL